MTADSSVREWTAPSSRAILTAVSAGEPEFLVCLNCETPTYVFEYTNGRLTSATCTACGNEDLNEFMSESELEEQRS